MRASRRADSSRRAGGDQPSLPLVGVRTRDGTRKKRQLIDVQFTIMILIGKRELLFEKSKHLIF
jgi:hypothetical protein